MFGYLASHATGIWMLIVIIFFGILAVQWIGWLFRWGRFGQEPAES